MFGFLNFGNKSSAIQAIIEERDGAVIVNVENQTCPGYLLSINKAIEKYPKGTNFTLKITYPPCGEDVESYCRQKKLEFLGMDTSQEGIYLIRIKK